MSSSNYYKIWLRDTSASTWREVTKFTDFTFEYKLNFVPRFSATFYLDDSNLQDLMVAGTPFRITGTDSDDGTVEELYFGDTTGTSGAVSGSREIINGKLLEPSADEKSDQRNSKPVIWDVSGRGYAKDLKDTVRDATSSRSNNAGTVISNYVTSDSSGDAVTGTLDSGPSINVLHRKDKIFEASMDIAGIGDGTDKFTYFIHVDADGSFNPRVNYYSPTHSETDWSFETSDPTGGTDDGRVLAQDSDVREFSQTEEDARIVNAIKVRYQGMGSGTGKSETSFATNSTSISNFGRRERIIYAPWVQDSSTATTLRDTVLNMFRGDDFNGNFNGINRSDVVLKDAGMFRSDFDATLGDVIAVEKSSTTKAIGRFLGFQYNQMQESLTVMLGLPRSRFFEDYAQTARRNRQAYNTLEATEAELISTTSSVVFRPSATSHSNIAFNSVSITNNGLSQQVVQSTETNFNSDAAGFDVLITVNTDSFFDGPLKLQLSGQASGESSFNMFEHTWSVMTTDDSFVSKQYFPFSLANSDKDTTFTLNATNDDDSQNVTISGNITVVPRPRPTVDHGSHSHNF